MNTLKRLVPAFPVELRYSDFPVNSANDVS